MKYLPLCRQPFNPLRANFFRGNKNIYLHFMSFLHTDMTQVVEILPRGRQKSILHSQYHGHWCPGDTKSHVINNSDFDYVEPNQFSSCALRVEIHFSLNACYVVHISLNFVGRFKTALSQYWFKQWYIPGQATIHGPVTRCVKLGVGHAPGMLVTFSLPPRVSDPDMHHGTYVTHVSWCMPGSITSGFLWSRWRGKRARYFRLMRNPQFYVSGKGPITQVMAATLSGACMNHLASMNYHIITSTCILVGLYFHHLHCIHETLCIHKEKCYNVFKRNKYCLQQRHNLVGNVECIIYIYLQHREVNRECDMLNILKAHV